MRSGKNTDILKNKAKIDWIDDYMKSLYAKPGTDFRYVNGTFICSHLCTGSRA